MQFSRRTAVCTIFVLTCTYVHFVLLDVACSDAACFQRMVVRNVIVFVCVCMTIIMNDYDDDDYYDGYDCGDDHNDGDYEDDGVDDDGNIKDSDDDDDDSDGDDGGSDAQNMIRKS